ncbi:class II fructose-bisphosphate aldolase [Aerococcus christensenii]|uniref:Putative tagatose-bisphosphate aldolase n=1 Tax=Aerococcus christensenii TaxID=87541 RepID=A0A133XUE1_9LACT|nr:class II fructose-bisphosphate aldolase [Aerococcus christensenii]KXB34556.1 putative tagatose-bisphosphate aldolase [Aerococcus christensenii]MDK8234089.1 class II fructose-bisphosphate aldolase family protein [Aerococcus christensenii]
MYTNLNNLLSKAEDLNYTIGAFNTHNLEMLPDIIRGAKEMGAPVIVQASAGTAEYIGYDVMVAVVKTMAEKYMVDVCLHLDHARNLEDIEKAIEAGFTSVMFDGSNLSFKENILKTKQVVEFAHERNVSVEGEIGTIGGTEEGISTTSDDILYTNPDDAVYFVEKTNVDALAVAIGTNHGQYRSKTEVNIPLLKKIYDKVNVPLVVHGGTGIKEEDYPDLINNGIRKFNVGTELNVRWNELVRKELDESKVNRSIRYNVIPGNTKVKDIVKEKIGLFMNLNTPLK